MRSKITPLLEAWRKGDPTAPGKLMPLVYDELRCIARRYMARESSSHTLQTAGLVNEVFMRMVKQRDVMWNDRIHFFAIAAQMMRRLLVDHARRRARRKRKEERDRVSLAEGPVASSERGTDVLALHHALQRLAALDPRKAQIVELRYFGALNIEELAEALGIAPVTVKREWSKAKAWLYNELRPEGEEDGP